MSFSNTTTSSLNFGNDSDTTFVVQFYYQLGRTQDITVLTYDVTGASPVEVVAPPFQIDETFYPNTQIIFDDPLPSSLAVVIARVTPTGQPTDFMPGPFPDEANESTLDFVAQKVQENYAALQNAGIDRFWEGGAFTPVTPPPAGAVTFNVVNVSAASYNANISDLIILRAATATNIILPASPNAGERVDVVCGVVEYNNKTIDANGSTILGVGAVYTFSSDYSSVTLAYSGSDWIIV